MQPPLTLSLRRLAPFGEALTVTAITAAAGFAVLRQFDVPNISLIFVIPVLAAAVRHGLVVSLWAATLSVVAYDYFFLPPLYRFTIADPADVVALVFLTVVALVASGLAGRVHDQAGKARREARITSELYDLSNKVAGVIDLGDVLWIVVSHAARAVNGEIVLLMPGDGSRTDGETAGLEVRAAFPPDVGLGPAETAAALRCWQFAHRTGGLNDPVTPARHFFLPVRTARSEIGVLGVLPLDPSGRLEDGDRELLEAVGNQTAVAIDRVALALDIDQARLGAEREKLRSSMLTSVSHDLRTPLASIVGALSSLNSHAERYEASTRAELIATALGEAERLDRFVGNLLDMTRLDAGAIVPRREPVDVGDLVSTALRRAAPLLKERGVSSQIEDALPPLRLDFVLAEQVLFNLLDNAAKYSPPGGRIEIAARRVGTDVEIVVRDDGPGIPPAALPHLFEKFYRADQGDRRPTGTGLGLAIARGFVQAEGGRIVARSRTDRSGAEFVVTYPVVS